MHLCVCHLSVALDVVASQAAASSPAVFCSCSSQPFIKLLLLLLLLCLLLCCCSCFLRGTPMGRKMASMLASGNPPTTHYRRAFVNRYPAVEPG
jgi:hypothetical protein